jgi:hypothetical protein
MAVMPPGEDLRLRLASAEREVGLHSAVFRRVPIPLVIVAGDGAVRALNEAASGVWGTSLGSATGHPVQDLVGPENREALAAALAALRSGEAASRYPVRVAGQEAVLVALPLDVLHADGFALVAVLDLVPPVPGGGPVSPPARRVPRGREAP